ncbi:MAG TPA: hypothetical protein VIX84_20595, partial [Acidimicrobiales bacterium]
LAVRFFAGRLVVFRFAGLRAGARFFVALRFVVFLAVRFFAGRFGAFRAGLRAGARLLVALRLVVFLAALRLVVFLAARLGAFFAGLRAGGRFAPFRVVRLAGIVSSHAGHVAESGRSCHAGWFEGGITTLWAWRESRTSDRFRTPHVCVQSLVGASR